MSLHANAADAISRLRSSVEDLDVAMADSIREFCKVPAESLTTDDLAEMQEVLRKIDSRFSDELLRLRRCLTSVENILRTMEQSAEIDRKAAETAQEPIVIMQPVENDGGAALALVGMVLLFVACFAFMLGSILV